MQIEEKNKTLSLNERINQIWSTTQGKTYTTAIATIIIVVLMVSFAIVPAYVSITDQLVLNNKKTTYIDDLAKKQQNLNTLSTQYQANSVSIRLLDIYVHNKIDNELVVATFSEIARQNSNNCTFKSVNFEDPEATKRIKNLNTNIRSITFNATFTCKIDAVKELYNSIINLPIPIYIDGVTYTNKKDQGGGGTSNFMYDTFAVTYSGEYYFWNLTTTTTITSNE